MEQYRTFFFFWNEGLGDQSQNYQLHPHEEKEDLCTHTHTQIGVYVGRTAFQNGSTNQTSQIHINEETECSFRGW